MFQLFAQLPVRVHRERSRRDGDSVTFAYGLYEVVLDQRGPVVNKALSHNVYPSEGIAKSFLILLSVILLHSIGMHGLLKKEFTYHLLSSRCGFEQSDAFR